MALIQVGDDFKYWAKPFAGFSLINFAVSIAVTACIATITIGSCVKRM
jgi:hypothetical protein